MTVYAIAQLTIHDRERYDRYANAFMPIITKFGGRLLAVEISEDRLAGADTVTVLVRGLRLP